MIERMRLYMKVSLKNFLLYNDHKKFTLLVWALTAFYRMCILRIPSKYMEPHWGVKNEESPREETHNNYKIAAYISREVNHAADQTPWKSECMVRALTAQYLLHRKNIASTLYFGVKADEQGKMTAHAWIRCGEYYVTGGNGEGYAVVGKYRK